MAILDFIPKWYNTRRRHSAIWYHSPAECERLCRKGAYGTHKKRFTNPRQADGSVRNSRSCQAEARECGFDAVAVLPGSDNVKILFLSANPVNVVNRFRSDIEYREISRVIHLGSRRDEMELVSEMAVRVGDLQPALMKHQPDIVHFSGHCNRSGEILLEDENGYCKPVSPEAFSELFSRLKGNISVVVLNACYAKGQADALSETVDSAIGMNDAIGDRAALVFASSFYQSLAFDHSVKESFGLALNQLSLEGLNNVHVPKLLEREGINASQPLIESVGNKTKPSRKSRLIAFLPWPIAAIAISLTTDVLRRFLVEDGSWWDTGTIIAQTVLITAAILSAALIAASLLRPANPLLDKAARVGFHNEPNKAWKAFFLTLITLVVALGVWLLLPVFARYYNERGIEFQYREPPDLSRARECYQRAVRLKQNYAQAHYNLATVNEDFQPEKAMEEYLLAIKYDSRIYPAYNNLARLYIIRGEGSDYESALNILGQANELSPQDESVQYSLNKNLGWAHYGLRRYPMAEMYLRRAILYGGPQGGAAAHCLLAYVLKEQGKAGVADECFDCVTLAPGDKGLEAKWVSDAQDCLRKGEGK